MTLIPDPMVTVADTMFIHQQWKTSWQYDRNVQGNQVCNVIRPTWEGADPATGEQGTRTNVILFADVPCYHSHILDEFIAASNSVYQAGAMEIVLYDIGSIEPKNSLIILNDGKQYKIVYQKYVIESGRSELRCNPYHA